jgi:hypothetical protein
MTLARLGLCLSALVDVTGPAGAGVIGQPTEPTPIPRQDVYSHNGSFVIDVNPDGSGNAIFAANDRSRPLWTLQGVLKTDVRQILLADHGSVVALIREIPLKYGEDQGQEEAVRLIDRNGRNLSYSVTEFNKKPGFASDGCGKSSLLWHDAVIDHGDHFVIRLEDGKQYSVEYSTAPRFGKWYKIAGAGVVCGMLLFLIRRAMRRKGAVDLVVDGLDSSEPVDAGQSAAAPA